MCEQGNTSLLFGSIMWVCLAREHRGSGVKDGRSVKDGMIGESIEMETGRYRL